MRKLQNPDIETLKICDEDLRPHIVNLYKKDLGSFAYLKNLILERCQLDIFAPLTLSDKVVNISLEGNRLDRLEIQFGAEVDEYQLEDVKIEVLNLQSNMFKVFPYKSLSTSPRLM